MRRRAEVEQAADELAEVLSAELDGHLDDDALLDWHLEGRVPQGERFDHIMMCDLCWQRLEALEVKMASDHERCLNG